MKLFSSTKYHTFAFCLMCACVVANSLLVLNGPEAVQQPAMLIGVGCLMAAVIHWHLGYKDE